MWQAVSWPQSWLVQLDLRKFYSIVDNLVYFLVMIKIRHAKKIEVRAIITIFAEKWASFDKFNPKPHTCLEKIPKNLFRKNEISIKNSFGYYSNRIFLCKSKFSQNWDWNLLRDVDKSWTGSESMPNFQNLWVLIQLVHMKPKTLVQFESIISTTIKDQINNRKQKFLISH